MLHSSPINKIRRALPFMFLPGLMLALVLTTLGIWAIQSYARQNRTQSGPGPGQKQKTSGQHTNMTISPLLFGTNMALFNEHDTLLTSPMAREHLRNLHPGIIRMPIRESLPENVEQQAAQVIKDLGATPLVILRGAVDKNVLADDERVVQYMHKIFASQAVYYEYGNEEDLLGVPVDRFTRSWNEVIPQLKLLDPTAQFIGPVTYHYDQRYLHTFLANARPRPDKISWHEYTCDDSWSQASCIAHIARWTTHITDARKTMRQTIKKELPIMITEWNYAPNAKIDDGKNNNSQFMSTWTNTAIQTLAYNGIFASMQYSCTNTAIPLLKPDGRLTDQAMSFQAQYQTMIIQHQLPTSLP